jgi:hypothetical protein
MKQRQFERHMCGIERTKMGDEDKSFIIYINLYYFDVVCLT